MKARISLLLTICLVSTAFTQQADELPKPGPEHQKMLEWCGEWTITGKTYTTPLGPGRKIQGKWIGRPILDGFAIEGIYLYDGYGPTGETQAKEITSYDPATNTYHYLFLSNNGYREQAPFTVEGAVAAWEGTQVIEGKEYQFRGSDTDLPDGSGFIRKGEISADGKTWQPLIEARHIRVETADSTPDEQELIKLQHEWCRAEVERDGAALGRLLADEYALVTSEAAVITRAQMLSNDEFKPTSMTPEDLKVQVYDDMAVVKGLIKWSEASGKSTQIVFTDTWLKRDGRWQCIATHESGAKETMASQALSPEMKKLTVFVGEWTYEGEQVDPPIAGLPFGPAGKFSGKFTTRFVLDGSFQESKWQDEVPSVTSGINITGYDAGAKKYVVNGHISDGSRSVRTATLDGRIWTSNSTMTTRKGEKVLVKSVTKYSSDWASYSSTVELSVDEGKTWKHWYREEGRKLKK